MTRDFNSLRLSFLQTANWWLASELALRARAVSVSCNRGARLERGRFSPLWKIVTLNCVA
jgi:hypothetical protein